MGERGKALYSLLNQGRGENRLQDREKKIFKHLHKQREQLSLLRGGRPVNCNGENEGSIAVVGDSLHLEFKDSFRGDERRRTRFPTEMGQTKGARKWEPD